MKNVSHNPVQYHSFSVDGINIFYRESGSKSHPKILLLHGFPSSSHMFRNLIPMLAEQYHVITPDYPGFGFSSMPDRAQFNYSFDTFAELVGKLLDHLKIDEYAIYIFDYGAPVGLRLFRKKPEQITAIISQNGNAYDEGLGKFWDQIKAYWQTSADKDREVLRWLTSLKATRWQYENGVAKDRLVYVSPDCLQIDQSLLDRPGNADIQLDIFYDYRTNLPLYPKWQQAFREHQPPLLAVWGKKDEIFVAPGAQAFKRDLPNAEIHLLDTGHYALETHCDEIASLITDFLDRNVAK